MKLHRSPTSNSDGIFSVSFSFILRSLLVRFSFGSRSVLDRFSFILRSSSVRAPFELRSSSVQPPFELRSTSVRAPFELRSTSVRAPFELRSTSVRAPFILRSTSVHPPFNLRSSSVQPPFNLRSSSVRSPFILRSFSVRESKIDWRTNGESSEAKRRCIETLMGNQGKGDSNKSFILNHLNSNYYGKTYPWLYHFSASSHSAYWKSMSYVKLMGGFGWCIDEVRSNSPLLWYRILI